MEGYKSRFIRTGDWTGNPHYLTHKDNTYYSRQSVPAELRSIVGKREIKKSLGCDYAWAVRECKRVAVDADKLF